MDIDESKIGALVKRYIEEYIRQFKLEHPEFSTDSLRQCLSSHSLLNNNLGAYIDSGDLSADLTITDNSYVSFVYSGFDLTKSLGGVSFSLTGSLGDYRLVDIERLLEHCIANIGSDVLPISAFVVAPQPLGGLVCELRVKSNILDSLLSRSLSINSNRQG